MSNPPPYLPSFSFSGYQETNPTSPLPGPMVDNEFANVSDSLNTTITALSSVRRSDGALVNGIVTPESLSSGLLIGVQTPTVWVTGFVYTAGNIVVQSNKFYLCLVAHTSGVFATDLAAVKWVEVTLSITGYSADQVLYDHAVSGLAAVNVKTALDEIDADVDTVQTDIAAIQATFLSTDAGAAVGPTRELFRDSPSPAPSDSLGQIAFYGRDSAGNKQLYADIYTVIVDPTSGSEDSTMNYRHTVAGVTTTHMQASATGVLIPTLAITAGAVISGVWTPTAALGTNAAVVSASEGRYTRVGNVVFCSVQLSCDPTSASVATDFFITLPVASDITSPTEITGGGGTDRGEAVFVLGVAATDRASVRYTPNSTSSSGIYVTFGYVVV